MNFSVFPDSLFPIDQPITEKNGIESNFIESFFRTYNRNQITINLLNSKYSHDPSACLGFMTPSAYAFFLPAFMRIAITEFDEANLIPFVIVWQLLDISNASDDDRKSAIIKNYSKDQLNEIIDFLSDMAKLHSEDFANDEPKQALSAWKKIVINVAQ